MTVEELTQIVTRSAPDQTWREKLEPRKKEELEFHDKIRNHETIASLPAAEQKQLTGNKKYYSASSDATEYLRVWMAEHCAGKVVLDFACGEGPLSLLAASGGAALCIGVDLSGLSIAQATRAAAAKGLSDRAIFIQGDVEHTGLPDECVDVVLCSGVLHHLDLSYAFPEIRRVLKPGGVAFAWEALAHNPLMKLYRYLTPKMRTNWEKRHILSQADVRFAARFFEVRNIRHWTLLSLFGVFCRPLIPALQSFDRLLLSLPVIKNLSWMFTFELWKATREETGDVALL